jgi:nucleoside 2-deoxyribosyltransferase
MKQIKQYLTHLPFKTEDLPNDNPYVSTIRIFYDDPHVDTVINWGLDDVDYDDPHVDTMFDLGLDDDDDILWLSIKDKLKKVLGNGYGFEPNVIYDSKKLKEFVDGHFLILTPDEKLDNILEYVDSKSGYEGQLVYVVADFHDDNNNLYFTESREWEFYLASAEQLGFLEKIIEHNKKSDKDYQLHRLTIAGLTRVSKIKEQKQSRYCFVAMAFTEEINTIYEESIKSAIMATGFIPYVVNRVDLESDKTINDAIIAGLKKARFTIADFTYHRAGVYFEAGYALGRGQKVIYTCREDQWPHSHFDINHYQHIIWADAIDLKEKLIFKIEAFIKD